MNVEEITKAIREQITLSVDDDDALHSFLTLDSLQRLLNLSLYTKTQHPTEISDYTKHSCKHNNK